MKGIDTGDLFHDVFAGEGLLFHPRFARNLGVNGVLIKPPWRPARWIDRDMMQVVVRLVKSRRENVSQNTGKRIVRAIHEAFIKYPRGMAVQIWTTNGFSLNRAGTSPRPYFGNWQPTALEL